MTKASILEIESTLISDYAGDTKGKSIVVTAKGSADRGETAQQFGQHGLISNPAKNTLGLRLTQGSLDIIIGGLNYTVPLPENMGETLLFSTDAEGAIKSTVLLDTEGNFIFNDGADNAVRYSELETAYNAVNDKLNDLITKYNAHIHVTTATVSATAIPGVISPTTSSETPSTGDITPSKIEEIKVP